MLFLRYLPAPGPSHRCSAADLHVVHPTVLQDHVTPAVGCVKHGTHGRRVLGGVERLERLQLEHLARHELRRGEGNQQFNDAPPMVGPMITITNSEIPKASDLKQLDEGHARRPAP